MAHLSLLRRSAIGTYPLTRDGIDLSPALAAGQACWNFALTGTLIGMAAATAPDAIMSGNGNGHDPDAAILNINPFTNVCAGLRDTAIVGNHPGCAAELQTLRDNVVAAIAGTGAAERACAEALLGIMARKNGLTPGVGADTYQLHMVSHTWFGWDHFALSFRRTQAGQPRVFIQKVPDTCISHACDRIWDEQLPVSVTLNIDQLHPQQVALIDNVGFGPLCATCSIAHGLFPSTPFNAWHQCTVCQADYCPTHGGLLGGKRPFDRTRACGQHGCAGRTRIISWT